MQGEFTTIIHNLVLDNPMAAKDLAKALGKPYSTLLREVNPYDTGAKLGAETLFQIMAITGNIKPMEYMSSKLGLEITPVVNSNNVPHVTLGAFNGNVEDDMEFSDISSVCPNCGKEHVIQASP